MQHWPDESLHLEAAISLKEILKERVLSQFSDKYTYSGY